MNLAGIGLGIGVVLFRVGAVEHLMGRCLFKKLSVECDLEPKIFRREHVCADVKVTLYSGRP